MRTLGSESSQQTRSCSRSSTTKAAPSSPTGPKISSALSTRLAESSFAFSTSATRGASRLSGCGHVDNARALPTCPQPQQQIQKSNHSRGLNAHRFSRGGQKYGTFGAMSREAILCEVGNYAVAVVGLSAAVNFGLVRALTNYDSTPYKTAAVASASVSINWFPSGRHF